MSVRRLVPLNAVALASDPATGQVGDVYYNTTDNKLKFYNGVSWELFASDASNQLLIHTHTYDGDIYEVQEASVSATQIDGGTTIDNDFSESIVIDGGTP